MDTRYRFGLIALLAMAGAGPVTAQVPSDPSASTPPKQSPTHSGAAPAASPDAGSPSAVLIARGEVVFNGSGNCYACHGSKATGSVGPSLVDAEWIHSKGTLEDIEAQIIHGVTKEESKTGIVMPPKGGGTMSDDDVKAVAAYVYSLRQK